MASSFLDVCRFNPTAGGTTDWTYSSAVTGYQSPTAAGAVNGAIYSYRAESSDLTQWEVGFGAYNSGTGVFARTTVLFNSAGTTAKISFSAAPQVAIVAIGEDLPSLVNANSFAGAQTVSNVTDATSSSAGGAFTIAGGLAVAKKLFVGLAATIVGALSITDSTASTTTTTGALKVTGGAGIGGAVNIGGAFSAQKTTTPAAGTVGTFSDSSGAAIVTISNTHATAGDTGLLVCAGAAGADTTSSIIQFDDGGAATFCGRVRRNGSGAVAYDTTSDIKGKPNRELLDLQLARDVIDALKIWDFDKDGNAIRGIGVIAQHAHAVHPSLASPGATPEAWWSAEKAAPVPFLVANVQLINSRLDVLESRLAQLERSRDGD